MAEKYQYYKGVKFTRDDKTGYYLNSTLRERMHRYVWRDIYGDIPNGCEIHHIDGDRSNNDISNIMCLSAEAHRKHHADNLTEEQREKLRENMNENARPAAAEWHRSEAGKEWHKQHYSRFSHLLHEKVEKVCENCGAAFVGTPCSLFCSNACKSAYRRKMKADYITKVCPVCYKEYETNKYKAALTCGRSCANVLKWRLKREGKENCPA